jgi:hypothetical protein
MNEILKNPIGLVVVGFIAIWLVLKFFGTIINLVALAIVILAVFYFINPRFRSIVRGFTKIFIK